MFNIGGSELALILLAALLLLGPSRIPGFVRAAGRWYREFLKMKEQVDASLSEYREEIEKEGKPLRQLGEELEGIRRHALPVSAAEAADPPQATAETASSPEAAAPEKSQGAQALIRPPEGRTLASGSLDAQDASEPASAEEERP